MPIIRNHYINEPYTKIHIKVINDSKISFNWNDEAERRKDSLMKVVGLTKDEFEDIRHHLGRIGCIGIKKDTSHPNGKTVIYFCRVKMGRYSFILYDNPISQEEKEKFYSLCKSRQGTDTKCGIGTAG